MEVNVQEENLPEEAADEVQKEELDAVTETQEEEVIVSEEKQEQEVTASETEAVEGV